MRRLTVWALQVALFLGLGAALCSAQEPDQNSAPDKAKSGWLSRLFPFGKRAEDKATPAPKKTAAATAPALSGAALRDREKAILDRRQDVCARIYDIAVQNNDEALRRRADQLNERAFTLYLQHTGQIARTGAAFESDKQTLDNHLGVGTNGQTPGAASVGAGADSASRTASRRE